MRARCVKCGKEYEATANLTNCECGGILDIIYDYDYIKKNLTKGKAQEPPEHDVALPRAAAHGGDHARHAPARGLEPALRGGPSCKAPRPQEAVGEGRRPEPHRVLKDRASAMAVAKAKEAGAEIIACSSTGNAASSLAGNAAAAGLKTFIFVPSRAPQGRGRSRS